MPGPIVPGIVLSGLAPFRPALTLESMINLPHTIPATLDLLSRENYVADRSFATLVFLALRMGRPLFLEGEAGVG